MEITVVICAYNEEKLIKGAIESAYLLTDDVLVVDTESIDSTFEIAKKLGCRVVTFPYNRYVEPARNFAMKSAKGNWVFILDADERITPKLAQEIKKVLLETSHSYFYIPRKNIFAGRKWLEHGGWYPDPVLRLIHKKSFKKWPHQIHSTPDISGTRGDLTHQIEHFFHPSLENMVQKTVVYEDIESSLLHNAGRDASLKIFFRKYFGELNRRLFKKAGYLDGSYGVIESFYQAYSKTITYLMLYEKNHK